MLSVNSMGVLLAACGYFLWIGATSTMLMILPAVSSFQMPLLTKARTMQLTKVRMTDASSRTTNAAPARQPTLTPDTVWKLRLILRGVATAKGKKVDEIFVLSGSFVEEEGYEPPQGFFAQLSLSQQGDNDGVEQRLQIVKSRWQLSEDPEDRKDGLWIWGLFKEPLYPFMLLQLETAAVPLVGRTDDDKDFILPLQLYAQVNHKRKDGAVLLDGTTEVKVRQMETINADPFGASKVDIYEEVSIGSLAIRPVA